jgi:hypothetical protein
MHDSHGPRVKAAASRGLTSGDDHDISFASKLRLVTTQTSADIIRFHDLGDAEKSLPCGLVSFG